MILHIVLLILKIIGIALAALTGLVLLLLCLALFVPVRYRLKVSGNEGGEEPPVRLKARVSWLFPLFQVKLLYPSDVYLRVKLLFFTVFRMPSKEKADGKASRKTKNSDKKNAKRKKTKKNETDKEDSGEGGLEEKISDKSRVTVKQEGQDEKSGQDQILKTEAMGADAGAGSAIQAKSVTETTDSDADDKTDEQHEKQSILDRIKAVLDKITQVFQKIRYTIESLCDKIKGLRENTSYYAELLQSESFIQAFGLCKGELISILTCIRPKKVEADFVVGMGDPASTGQVLSIYGILIPFIGNHVRVTGDFEQKRIEGTLFIKGKMTLFRFVKTACRIYFNRDIRKLIRFLKKEDE